MQLPWKFRLWSETKPSAKKAIQAPTSWRNWSDLDEDEKRLMLQHLNRKSYFWGEMIDRNSRREVQETELVMAIYGLNEKYKKASYARNFLQSRGASAAHQDFIAIWNSGDEDVVLELLSLYAYFLYLEKENESLYQRDGESDEEYKERFIKWRMASLDKFRNVLNEILEQFGVNVYLTRAGFVPRQDKKVIENIYEPVIDCLSDERWKPTERDLRDAFEAFSSKNPKGYSECITHCCSAVQAFLQELVQSDIKKPSIATLMKEAKQKSLIPNDSFSETVLSKLQESFEEMRQKYGDPHPKEEYANEQNALLTLNITMVFLQHCITHL